MNFDSEFLGKGIRFCTNCFNMLNPVEEEKTLKFACRYCPYKEQVNDPNSLDENLIYRKEIKDKQSNSQNYDPELALDATMPRIRNEICPSCKYNEAVYFMAANTEDTKLRKVFICARIEDGVPKCGHHWFSDNPKNANEEIIFD